MPYIDVQGLTKTFTVRKKRDGHLLREKSTVCALDHVSFQVELGELLGYIGPQRRGQKHHGKAAVRHPDRRRWHSHGWRPDTLAKP